MKNLDDDVLDLLRVFGAEVHLNSTVVLTTRRRVLALGRGLIIGAPDFCRVEGGPETPRLAAPQNGDDLLGDRLYLWMIKKAQPDLGVPLDSCHLHGDHLLPNNGLTFEQLQGKARGRSIMVRPMLIFEFERVFAGEVFDAAVGVQVDLPFFRTHVLHAANASNTRDPSASGNRESAKRASTSFAI